MTNAVYFLGDWADQFKKSATTQQPFYLLSGGARQVPLMFRKGQYRTFRTETFTAIDLPYKDERLSMTVFLPHARTGLPAVEAGLSSERLTEWLSKLDAAHPGKTQLYLPRLEITGKYDLGKPLSAMGMGLAFTPYKANFRGIADADLYIAAEEDERPRLARLAASEPDPSRKQPSSRMMRPLYPARSWIPLALVSRGNRRTCFSRDASVKAAGLGFGKCSLSSGPNFQPRSAATRRNTGSPTAIPSSTKP